MAGKKAKKQSKMLRELKAHNDSPEPETEAEAGFDFDGDTHAVRKTRNVTKTLGKLAKKQELSPKKTQNVLSLMLEQFNPDRGRKTYYPEGSSEVMMSSPGKRVRYNSKVDFLDEEEEVLDNGDVEDSTHEVRRSRRQSSSPRSVEQDYSPVPISQFIQDTGRKAAWKVWENQKGKYIFS